MTDFSLIVPDPAAPGPVPGVSLWRHTARLSKAGEILAEMSGMDARVTLLQCQQNAELMSGMQRYGAGIITEITKRHRQDGTVDVTVRGPDKLAKLARRTVRNLKLGSGSDDNPTPESITSALGKIMAYAPPGWTIDTTTHVSTGSTIFFEFAGESVLEALVKVATQLGENFILDGTNPNVIWLYKNEPHSGLVAQKQGGANNPDVCVIVDEPVQEVSSEDTVTRIYAFGDGNGNRRRTLPDTWTSPDPNYELLVDAGARCIRYIPTDADADKRIEEQKSYNDINSRDQLAIACYEDLRRRVQDHRRMTLTVTRVQKTLRPGMLITVIDRADGSGGRVFDLNDTLVVLERTTELNGDPETISLMLASSDLWPRNDGDTVRAVARSVSNVTAHSQPTDRATLADSAMSATTTTDPAVARTDTAQTFTAAQTFMAALATAYATVTANTTLGTTHSVVGVDATGGARTITLPSAATCAGRMYVVKKRDASANAVTVATTSSQTIDGAATVVLAAQWASVSVVSDGAGWLVV